MRALELIEEKGHDRHGGQNDFKKALEDVENNERELRNKNTKGKKKDDTDPGANSVLDLGLIKTDPDKLYPLIYYALKRTLKEWEEAMDERPGALSLETSFFGLTVFQSTSSAPLRANWLQQPKYSLQNISSLCSRPFVPGHVDSFSQQHFIA